MFKTYTSEVEITAIRIEGDLFDLCEILRRIAPDAHPMWKMPGGYSHNREPNAVMFKDIHLGWVEAELNDYVVKTNIGPRLIPGHVFDMFFMEY